MTSAVAPLRYGPFRAMWVASILSAVGSFIQTVAASWLMWELTESNTWVSLMVASTTLPLLFFALAAGALADMFDRAKLMLVAQTTMGVSALAMAVLTGLGVISPGWLLALGLILGLGVSLNLPTWQALLPNLVPRGMIASAVALQSAGFNVARAVGPALGGAVVATIGPGAGFGINAFTYGFVIAALIVVGKTLAAQERQATSIGSAIGTGLRYARFTLHFRRLLVLVAIFAVTSSVVQAVLPGLTVALGGDAGALGLLLGSMGAGALVGALIRQRVLDRLRHRAQRGTIVAFGVAGIGLGLAPDLVWAGVAMFFAGAFWLLTLATLNAIAQLMTPEWIRGRAMSLYSLAFGGILPIGAIISGVLADAMGTGEAIVVLSSGAALLGVLSPLFRIPSLDEVESPEFSADRPAAIHDETAEGGPVLVLNTWEVDPAEFEEFLAVMSQVRLIRLRTGAYRWRLLRNVSEPRRLTELFAMGSWEDHLAQHHRIDDASAAVLARARSFDRGEGPVTRHLIDVDVEDPPNLEELVAVHRALHQTDGSIPNLSDQS